MDVLRDVLVSYLSDLCPMYYLIMFNHIYYKNPKQDKKTAN